MRLSVRSTSIFRDPDQPGASFQRCQDCHCAGAGFLRFFKNVGDNGESLQNVQWIYLAIACFVFLLALVFYFSTIPEITDADMMFQVSVKLACIASPCADTDGLAG